MSVSWDFNTATLTLIGLQVIGFVVFIVRTHNKAIEAHETAEKAHKRADDAHLSVSAQAANLSLFREQVASNYVDREALREIKRELIDAINKLGDRFDQSIQKR
jgi:uncharacterized membrane protein